MPKNKKNSGKETKDPKNSIPSLSNPITHGVNRDEASQPDPSSVNSSPLNNCTYNLRSNSNQADLNFVDSQNPRQSHMSKRATTNELINPARTGIVSEGEEIEIASIETTTVLPPPATTGKEADHHQVNIGQDSSNSPALSGTGFGEDSEKSPAITKTTSSSGDVDNSSRVPPMPPPPVFTSSGSNFNVEQFSSSHIDQEQAHDHMSKRPKPVCFVHTNPASETSLSRNPPVVTSLDSMGRLPPIENTTNASSPCLYASAIRAANDLISSASRDRNRILEPNMQPITSSLQAEILNGLPNSPKVQTPRTYASIFKDAENIRNKGTLRFIAPLVTDLGAKRAIIPDELIAKQTESWSRTLIGYFIGKRPAFQFVKFHATRLWKRFDLEDVLVNDQGYFYLKFKTEQGLNQVFESGPWLFNDIPILLKKWQPDVWFEKPVPTEVSIWINIHDMHEILWDYEILSHIVSTIGIPIAVDRYTAEMCEKKTGRAAFARVLVQISSTQEIPRFAEAEIMKIVRKFRLEYNWIPPRCSHCKIFGHVLNDCSERPRTDAEIAKKVDVTPAALANDDDPFGVDDQGFQQPKRRKRSAKTTQKSGIRVTASKPKVQYVPKITQPGKGKDQQTKGTTQPLDTVFLDPSASSTGRDSQHGLGVHTSASPVPNIEIRNPYDVLGGLNTEIGCSSFLPLVECDPEESEDEVYAEDNPTAQFMQS